MSAAYIVPCALCRHSAGEPRHRDEQHPYLDPGSSKDRVPPSLDIRQILIPCALFLASKARAGQFDAAFYTVQSLELVARATNITLLGLNLRDGLRLTGRLRKREVK